MTRRMTGLIVLMMTLACGVAAAEQRRGVSVEDIVSTEAFGRASRSPDGRWAVYEKRAAYDRAPRFDLGARSQWATVDLWLADLRRPDQPARPLAQGEGPGLLLGEWSPSGQRLVVQRLRGQRLEFGVATPSAGTVQWTGLAADMPTTGAATAWLSDDRLVVLTRTDDGPPALLRYYSGSQTERIGAWRRTEEGREPSRTIVDTRDGVFSAERPDPDLALVLVDLGAGTRTVLFTGAVRDLSASPDGANLAFLEAGAVVPVEAERVVQMEVPRRQRLRLVDVDSGRIAYPDDRLDVAPHLLRWNRRSSDLLVFARSDGEDWRDGAVVRVERGGAVARLNGGGLVTPPFGVGVDTLRGVVADWMGDTPIVYGRLEGASRADWFALSRDRAPEILTATLAAPPPRLSGVDGDGVRFFADGAAWRASSGGLEAIGPRDLGLREVTIGDVEKPFRLRTNSPAFRQWDAGVDGAGRVTVLDGGRQVKFQADPSARILGVSPDALLFLHKTGLSETMRLTTAEGTVEIDAVNTDLRTVDVGRPRLIDHLDALGRPTQSALWLPPGQEAGSVKGLIVAVYPGLVDRGELATPLTLTYSLRAAVLASGGYAVLSPSVPVTGEGVHEPAFFLKSVDLAVDAALAAEPGLPSDRMAVAGHSFGGQVSLLIAAQTRRYRAYVSWAGPMDLAGYWGEFAPASRILTEGGPMMRGQQGWVEVGHGAIQGPPWRDAEAYVTHSPFGRVDSIRDPVLLVSADNDFVPLSQAELMFSAFYRLGVRARLVTYWGEEHALWSPANIRDLYGQVFSFLDEALAPQGAPPRPLPKPRQPPPR
jgi:dipeptidyl aminopeptidase/acylaminoacyl peptidase